MKRKVRIFLSVFRIRLAECLQYRAAAWSTLAVGVFWGFVMVILYTALFRYSNSDAAASSGMTLAQTVSYVWLTESFFSLLSISPDPELTRVISSGDIGIELLRPTGLYSYWFAKSIAHTAGNGWLRTLGTLAVGFLMPAAWRLQIPASPANFAAFLAAILLGTLEASAYCMFLAALQMNVTVGSGPSNIIMALSVLFAGGEIPLRFWPQSMQTFLAVQPFAGFGDFPLQCWIGTLSPYDALPRMGLQLAWTLIFFLAGRILMNRRLRTVIVQGG